MADEFTEHRDQEQLRRGVKALLEPLFAASDEQEAARPHVVLIFDPETRRHSAIGPFDDRLSARVGLELMRAHFDRSELGDLQLTPIPLEPFDAITTRPKADLPTGTCSRCGVTVRQLGHGRLWMDESGSLRCDEGTRHTADAPPGE